MHVPYFVYNNVFKQTLGQAFTVLQKLLLDSEIFTAYKTTVPSTHVVTHSKIAFFCKTHCL